MPTQNMPQRGDNLARKDGPGGRPNFRGRRDNRDDAGSEYEKKVLQVDRVARTVRGGKRVRFRALVIMGNRNGKVGIGIGKATEVVDAVNKASKIAQKEMIDVTIVNETIPHYIEMVYGSAHIILRPAKPGTSIVAGGAIRTICDLAGIKNVVAKILGTANKINNSKATIEALKRLAIESKEENAAK
jgi:small subunit ribosomal protein S5